MKEHVYTQTQLDGMSDVGITVACAEKLGLHCVAPRRGKSVYYTPCPDVMHTRVFEPLTNYSDCMPIAERHIGLIDRVTNGWEACSVSARVTQPTIQRAIVYCFLLTEEV